MQAYSQRYYNDQSSQQEQQYYRSSSTPPPSQYGSMQQSQYGSNQSQYGSNQSQYGSNQSQYGLNQSQYGSAQAHQSQYGGAQAQQSRYGSQANQSQYGGMQQLQQQQQPQQYAAAAAGMQNSSASLSASSFQQSSSLSQSKTNMMSVFGQDPFCEITPSHFPPGTDPKIVECFNRIDRDGNGVVDDMELQAVLSSFNYRFNMRTVHLLMFEFTHSNKRILGPREFVPLMKCLQSWRTMFQRFDRDRNGSIDSSELCQAFISLGFSVSPVIVNLLISKFDKSGLGHCTLQYDSFIECCLTVRGLTETFNAKAECGRATFGYEEFLLNVLPFIIA